MFLRNTDKILNNTALADASGRTRTYGKLEQLSGDYLQQIPERSLVFILCDYHMDTASFYYCMMNNHVVPLLLDKGLDREMLKKLISIYQPQFIWMEKGRQADFPDFIMRREYERHSLFQTLYKKYEIYPELALLLTTSGSTGSPKLVRISYKNLIENTKSINGLLDIRETDRGITVLPMTYCYGLSLLHMHWMVGGSIFLNEWSVINGKFWDYLVQSKITNFQGVPYTYEMLEKIGFLNKEYPFLRLISQGGAKLPEDRQKLFATKLQKKGMDFFILYGQTEGSTYLSGFHAGKHPNKIGSIGCAVPKMQAFLETVENGIGELVFYGDSVTLGYAEKKEDLCNGCSWGKKLSTGDLAYIDEEGYIFIKGRLKRIIKMLGSRINLDEIESLLAMEFPSVEFACKGSDNELKTYYVGTLNEASAKSFCMNKIGLHIQMLQFIKLEYFPRNEAGKIDYIKIT